MNIENKKPIDTNVTIKTTLVFYQEPPEPDTIGSNDIVYEINYDTEKGIMSIENIGAFGDRQLVAKYRDVTNRGITLNEMLENIQELANTTYKDFKKLIGKNIILKL